MQNITFNYRKDGEFTQYNLSFMKTSETNFHHVQEIQHGGSAAEGEGERRAILFGRRCAGGTERHPRCPGALPSEVLQGSQGSVLGCETSPVTLLRLKLKNMRMSPLIVILYDL